MQAIRVQAGGRRRPRCRPVAEVHGCRQQSGTYAAPLAFGREDEPAQSRAAVWRFPAVDRNGADDPAIELGDPEAVIRGIEAREKLSELRLPQRSASLEAALVLPLRSKGQ